MARRRARASKRRASSRKAARRAPKAAYMCVHCGYKSNKPGMHCDTECVRC